MTYLFLVIIGVVVAVAFVFWVSRKEAEKHGTSTREEFVGICRSAIETASQKEGRKEHALALLRERGKLSNAQIRKALSVSGRSVQRYMDTLEEENKVEQVGSMGRGVVYRLK